MAEPDIVERIRGLALFAEGQGWREPAADLFLAATEIERLRGELDAIAHMRNVASARPAIARAKRALGLLPGGGQADG